MIPIAGLYESHLTVFDLERSVRFYRDVVGLEFAHAVPARRAAFLWVGGRERSMLGLWEIGSSPIRARLHIAFAASLDDVVASVPALRARGIVPRAGGGGPEIGEPVVFPWMPAASVYFDDPDGHSLEYIAILPGAARPELAGRVKLSEWRAMADAWELMSDRPAEHGEYGTTDDEGDVAQRVHGEAGTNAAAAMPGASSKTMAIGSTKRGLSIPTQRCAARNRAPVTIATGRDANVDVARSKAGRGKPLGGGREKAERDICFGRPR